MSNITLHQATEQVRALLEQIDPETGELPEGFDDARAVVAHKAVAVAAYIIESTLQTESIRDYIKTLTDKVKSEERRQDWLRRYLQDHMAAAGISEISDDRGIFKASLAVGRDESVEVFDEAQLPAEYVREVVKTEPNKTAIKDAIKKGTEVPGARIIKRDRLTIK
jgi:hypothetical protein